ncbi:MAG: hypothetical protein OXT68_15495 [Chloroflexota bacterium]|nr:hypothetical protein [Chloroflexota bacterium]
MRVHSGLLLLAAVFGAVIVLAVGSLLLSPPLPLIMYAGFDRDSISPDADGENDIAVFEYRLSRPATIDLSLTEDGGKTFFFRNGQAREAEEYSVLFSGVVDGFLLEGETVVGHVERRLLPQGTYTWQLNARTEAGEDVNASGRLLVQPGDFPLPVMSTFTVSPPVFSPNQDGVDDRVQINIYLETDVESLDVYLVDSAGVRIPISARVEERNYGEAGRHRFDYEGGIDLGVDPPPDGAYQVLALAQDAVGQRIRQETSLTIETGGKPYAEISPQAIGVDVAFDVQPYEDRYFTSRDYAGTLLGLPEDSESLAYSQQITIPKGDLLVFRLSVENYGDVPIRTSGPPPGTVYQQEQQAATLGRFDESGAWRIGIQCSTSQASYPYRWAIAAADKLVEVFDEASGNTYSYLPAKERAVVWGAIRMTTIEARNPQNCWAGLIHEDVAISLRNNHVGVRSIMTVDPGEPAGDLDG